MTTRKLGVVILALWAMFLASALAQSDPSRKKLSLYEARLLADNIMGKRFEFNSRGEIAGLWDCIDVFVENGLIDGCEPYLSLGLQHDPERMKYQILLAEILAQRGQQDQAREKARLVLKNGDPAFRQRALDLLGSPERPDTPLPSSEAGTSTWRIYLIPVAPFDDWMIEGIARKLSSYLGIPVAIDPASFPSYPPDLDTAQIVMKQIAKECDSNPELSQLIGPYDFEEMSWRMDEAIIAKYLEWRGKDDPNKVAAWVRKRLKFHEKTPLQYDADNLVAKLQAFLTDRGKDHTAFLAIGRIDLGSDRLNFQFISTSILEGIGAIGCQRFSSQFNGEAPDPEREISRVFKCCLTSAGYIMGLERCSDPLCPRSAIGSVDDQDKKMDRLCPSCAREFGRQVSRKIEPY